MGAWFTLHLFDDEFFNSDVIQDFTEASDHFLLS